MKLLKQLFNLYINSSIHVALSCYSLVRLTQIMFHIQHDELIASYAFFGTIIGYNFVKYDALARAKKSKMRPELKLIAVVSFIAAILAAFYFVQLDRITQIVGIGFLSLTLLYTLPFFPNKNNARNWAGIKIYIVALCWVGVTVFLPVLNAEIPISTEFYIICLQRFLIIFVLILIFEIIDLAKDDPHLKTVPQMIGVRKTKSVGMLLLTLFFLMEFLHHALNQSVIIINLLLVITIGLFLAFANEKKSKYFTSFWVESIPIAWWILFLLLQ